MGGSCFASVIVKATFGLVHGGPARLIAPVGLARSDKHHDGSPASSLEEASEIAPYLPCGGVTLRGHAHAPSGKTVPAMSVRLAIYRDRPLIEKTLHVFGDRTRTSQSSSNPVPFQRVPIVYERAFGGSSVDENPVGVGADPAGRSLPNIVDPTDPRRPAGFGPISRYWGSRKRLLGGAERRSLEAPVAEIPDGFDWRYFLAAPADQQLEPLAGDEWIVLDGLNASLPRLQARLPSARGLARWFASTPQGPGPMTAIELAADTLVIDSDRQLCSVIWRGNFPVEGPEAARRLRVLAGVELAGHPLVWPDPKDVPAPPAEEDEPPSRRKDDASVDVGGRPAAPSPARPVVDELAMTRGIDAREVASRAVTPFVSRSPARPDASSSSTSTATTRQVAPSHPPDRESSTRMMNVDEIAARGRGPAVPFAPSAGVARSASPPAGIPGAPFGAPKPEGAQGGQPSNWQKPQPSLGSTTAGESTTPLRLKDVKAALPFVAPDPGRPPAIITMAPSPKERAQKIMTGTTEFKLPIVPGAAMPFGASAREGSSEGQGAIVAEPPGAAEVRAEQPSLMNVAPPAMISPPAMVSPPAMTSPPAMVSPPAMMSPPAMTSPPAMVPSASPPAPVDVPAPAPIDPPRAASVPAAPPEPPPPAEAPPIPRETSVAAAAPEDSGLRSTVVARLRAREAISDLPLADADLSGLDLTGARLSGANLKGTKLARANLTNAHLGEAQLIGADLTDACLSGADLSRADLTRAVLDGARFEGAILAETNLSSARGPRAVFDRVTGRRAVFARGAWDGASFVGMDMMGADFTGASVTDADLKGASLIDVRLDDVSGERASFDGAKLSQAHAQGATITKSSFKDVDAPGSDWEKATISESSFAGANLKGASLLRATCVKTSFAGSELGGANLQRLSGDGADLSGASMEGVDLRQARLQEASFNDAKMQRANANKADLTRSRFARADLTGANLRASKLKGANLARALLDAADLRDADLEQANVFGASRQTAKMSGANTKDLVETDPDAS